MTVKPCLKCRKGTRAGSYCPKCKPQKQMNPRYNDTEYVKNRARVLKIHRTHQGNWCPGLPEAGHPPHPATDLTVDHRVPLNRGGTHDMSNLRVMCRSINSSIKDR